MSGEFLDGPGSPGLDAAGEGKLEEASFVAATRVQMPGLRKRSWLCIVSALRARVARVLAFSADRLLAALEVSCVQLFG